MLHHRFDLILTPPCHQPPANLCRWWRSYVDHPPRDLPTHRIIGRRLAPTSSVRVFDPVDYGNSGPLARVLRLVAPMHDVPYFGMDSTATTAMRTNHTLKTIPLPGLRFLYCLTCLQALIFCSTLDEFLPVSDRRSGEIVF